MVFSAVVWVETAGKRLQFNVPVFADGQIDPFAEIAVELHRLVRHAVNDAQRAEAGGDAVDHAAQVGPLDLQSLFLLQFDLGQLKFLLSFDDVRDVAVDGVQMLRLRSSSCRGQRGGAADPRGAAFCGYAHIQHKGLPAFRNGCGRRTAQRFQLFAVFADKIRLHVAMEEPLVLFARIADHAAHGVVVLDDGIVGEVDFKNADLAGVHQQVMVLDPLFKLVLEPLDVLLLARLRGDVLKAADQPHDLAADDQRAFAGHDVAVFTLRQAFSAYAAGAGAAAQNAQLVVFIGVRVRMPAHLLVILAEDGAHVLKAVIVKERPVGAQEAAVCVLPEDGGMGRGKYICQKRVMPQPVGGSLAAQLCLVLYVA